MTDRLYYTDSYLREFTARIVERSADGRTVYLDRTAFYPASGGQPCDTGAIAGVPVLDVVDERSASPTTSPRPLDSTVVECAHRLEPPLRSHAAAYRPARALGGVRRVVRHRTPSASIWARRVPPSTSKAAPWSRARCSKPSGAPTTSSLRTVPWRSISSLPPEVQGLRKPSEREGTLRIVSIEGLDRSACGGTHVRATGEVGPILLRKLDKVRQTVRVEFLCGGRAVRRARADYEALSETAQLFSAPLDEVPAMVAAQLETARANDKARRKLELDLAAYQGRELYLATAPGADGVRRVTRRVVKGSLEELRAIAQNFTAQPKAVFIATLADPPSVLLAASADAGIDAGKALKAALAEAGGRGGGNARIAQGSVAEAAVLDRVLEKL